MIHELCKRRRGGEGRNTRPTISRASCIGFVSYISAAFWQRKYFSLCIISTVSSIVEAKASQPASPSGMGRAAILFLAYIYKHKYIRPTFPTMKVIPFYTAKVAPMTEKCSKTKNWSTIDVERKVL